MSSRGAYRASRTPEEGAPTSFGARLRRIRVAWGLTQGQFGQLLHTDQQMISLWERGKTQPSRTGAALLASYFGLSVEALLTGEGFSIPDMPSPVDPKALTCQLPDLAQGGMAVVDLRTGKESSLRFEELKATIDQHHLRGNRVWVVVDTAGGKV